MRLLLTLTFPRAPITADLPSNAFNSIFQAAAARFLVVDTVRRTPCMIAFACFWNVRRLGDSTEPLKLLAYVRRVRTGLFPPLRL